MSEGTPSKTLPRTVEPRKMAQFGAEFEGILSNHLLPRLAEAVVSIGHLFASLIFGIDYQGRKTLTGKIEGAVQIECQRCMEPMEIPLVADVNLAIVWDEEQAKSLHKDMDPWIVEDSEAELYNILEEELLLALPVVAYHEYACIDQGLMSAGDSEEESPEETDNPFQVLAKLKKGQSDDKADD